MDIIPASKFPITMDYIQSIGESDTERALALGVKTPKTIERLRKRFPSQMRPFLESPHAIALLTRLLADLQALPDDPAQTGECKQTNVS